MTFTAPPPYSIRMAIAAAAHSPCAKSKRGVAVYDGVSGDFIVACANSPPHPFVCADVLRTRKAEAALVHCKEACAKIAVHAEQAAVIAAMELRHLAFTLPHAHRPGLVHAKVVDGELVAGGGPSCWQCSKFLLTVGVSGIWLYEKPQLDDGAVPPAWHFYTPIEFHMETLSNVDLPAYMRTHDAVEQIRQLGGIDLPERKS